MRRRFIAPRRLLCRTRCSNARPASCGGIETRLGAIEAALQSLSKRVECLEGSTESCTDNLLDKVAQNSSSSCIRLIQKRAELLKEYKTCKVNIIDELNEENIEKLETLEEKLHIINHLLKGRTV